MKVIPKPEMQSLRFAKIAYSKQLKRIEKQKDKIKELLIKCASAKIENNLQTAREIRLKLKQERAKLQHETEFAKHYKQQLRWEIKSCEKHLHRELPDGISRGFEPFVASQETLKLREEDSFD